MNWQFSSLGWQFVYKGHSLTHSFGISAIFTSELSFVRQVGSQLFGRAAWSGYGEQKKIKSVKICVEADDTLTLYLPSSLLLFRRWNRVVYFLVILLRCSDMTKMARNETTFGLFIPSPSYSNILERSANHPSIDGDAAPIYVQQVHQVGVRYGMLWFFVWIVNKCRNMNGARIMYGLSSSLKIVGVASNLDRIVSPGLSVTSQIGQCLMTSESRRSLNLKEGNWE